ncbi:MAG: hypothetical protein R3B84_11290 [Zavarzinella sp.]
MQLFFPAPILWGTLAAWIPLPPEFMAGLLCTVVVYAFLTHLLHIRDWETIDTRDLDDLPIWETPGALTLSGK